jgi:hypothetical protein
MEVRSQAESQGEGSTRCGPSWPRASELEYSLCERFGEGVAVKNRYWFTRSYLPFGATPSSWQGLLWLFSVIILSFLIGKTGFWLNEHPKWLEKHHLPIELYVIFYLLSFLTIIVGLVVCFARTDWSKPGR